MALAADSEPPDQSKAGLRETAGAVGLARVSLKAVARCPVRDPLDSSAGAAKAHSQSAL
jgi:hypothetical protein